MRLWWILNLSGASMFFCSLEVLLAVLPLTDALTIACTKLMLTMNSAIKPAISAITSQARRRSAGSRRNKARCAFLRQKFTLEDTIETPLEALAGV
jgi:hypothetical protein